MKKLLRNIANKYVRYFPKSWVTKWQLRDSQCFQIIKKPLSHYKSVYHIKDATWESMVMPAVWNMSKKYSVTMYHDAQDILCIDSAIISSESDIVITDKGVVWDKYETRMYNYMHVMDANVMMHDQDKVLVRNPKTTTYAQGKCISMLGVFEGVWAHFITQFLPKLYYAQEAGLLDQDITIILPEYTDANVKELVNNVLSIHPSCKLLIVPQHQNKRCVYQCETLYWIPTAAAMSNDTKIPILYQNVVPNQVVDLSYKRVYESYNETNENSNFEKIYLVRRGATRNVSNLEEVESFFRERGFAFVEPHKYTIAQKKSIFSNAKIIAGPQSSAWTNTVFCKNAKGLMLTPISWLFDANVGYGIRECACEVMVVAGDELEYKSSHNPYHIRMDELRDAYEYITKEII